MWAIQQIEAYRHSRKMNQWDRFDEMGQMEGWKILMDEHVRWDESVDYRAGDWL